MVKYINVPQRNTRLPTKYFAQERLSEHWFVKRNSRKVLLTSSINYPLF